ncbi:DASH family cryptochrome [Marinicella sediminis]|uniref:DASH family cryptochrome n=1 Tax=Marinicella sediminis TaxID=1792834 RepID=UPI0018E3CD35|nr:DASH family cryptochrome [Marinicella sediminis]
MKPKKYSRGLFLFTDDLRVDDHHLLSLATAECQALACVYVLQPWQFDPMWTLQSGMGRERFRFLMETLQDLSRQLKTRGLRLDIRIGHTTQLISKLVNAHDFKAVYRSMTAGNYEQKQWQHLRHKLPDTSLISGHTRSLFHLDQLPFELSGLSPSFTPFRKRIEAADLQPSPAPPLVAVNRLELSSKDHTEERLMSWLALVDSGQADNGFIGGTVAGEQHLARYFSSAAPSNYKTVRNALDGWANSTKFSPWLALGSLSPGQIHERLKQYEMQHGANESTYWIYFELLWREYFYWSGYLHGARLFWPGGVKGKPQVSLVDGLTLERFQAWCQGQTGNPLIDACMGQLNQTGYMSNRGRQLVASELINERQVDWRWGAAYFEQHLIDYDVGSNWGNWQYIAGVGADPRGGRHFNILKQQEQHDPQGLFAEAWADSEKARCISWQDLRSVD